jgi:hypothetical protein
MRSAVTAAAKQAGKAIKEELRGVVKDAAREAAREAAKEAFSQTLRAIRGFSSSAAPLGEDRYFGSAAPVVVTPPQGYPTLCECEEDVRAEITVDGHRVYTCHSCAPRGQALRDYKTILEAKKLGAPVPRRRPAYNVAGAKKDNQMAGSRRRKRVRKTRKRGRK